MATCTHNPCELEAAYKNCIPQLNTDGSECITPELWNSFARQLDFITEHTLPRMVAGEDIERCRIVYLKSDGTVTIDPNLSLNNEPIGVSVTAAIVDEYVRIFHIGIACVMLDNTPELGKWIEWNPVSNSYLKTNTRSNRSVGFIVDTNVSGTCGNSRVCLTARTLEPKYGIYETEQSYGYLRCFDTGPNWVYEETWSPYIPAPIHANTELVWTSANAFEVMDSAWYRISYLLYDFNIQEETLLRFTSSTGRVFFISLTSNYFYTNDQCLWSIRGFPESHYTTTFLEVDLLKGETYTIDCASRSEGNFIKSKISFQQLAFI